MKLSIGNLQPQQEITITIKMSVKIEAVTSSAYRLIIPIVLMERLPPPATKQGEMSLDTSAQPKKSEVKFQLAPSSPFHFKFTINKAGFHDVGLVHMSGLTKDEFRQESTEDQITFTLKEDVVHYPTVDIVILYKRDQRLETRESNFRQ